MATRLNVVAVIILDCKIFIFLKFVCLIFLPHVHYHANDLYKNKDNKCQALPLGGSK